MPDQKKAPEYTAFEAVYAALKDLSPEVRSRVIDSVFALLGIKGSQEVTQAATGEVQQVHEASRRVGLAELVKEKKANTNIKRIAVYAYFREKYQNIPKFSRRQLEDYFSIARDNPPHNYDRDFNEAVKKGWIHEEGDNSYLTTTGTEAVEEGFPGEARPTAKPHKSKT